MDRFNFRSLPLAHNEKSSGTAPSDPRLPFRELNRPSPDYNPVDFRDFSNPSRLGCYANDIYCNLLQQESALCPSKSNFTEQSEITFSMRSILVDWLVTVHLKYKFRPETLYLTVSLLDRYLSEKPIKRLHFQLLGAVCLFIAAKYEEIHPLSIYNLVYITDSACKRNEVLKMETEVLSTVQFNIGVPSTFIFIQRYSHLTEVPVKEFYLACYLSELALLEFEMGKYKPSVLAGAALYVALRIVKAENYWNKLEFVIHSCSEVIECAKDLALLFSAAPGCSLVGVRNKYASQECYGVSLLRV